MRFSRRAFLGAAAAAAVGAQPLARGALAAPAALPRPARSGIDHVVLVVMENRSFDHLLGWLPGADGKQAGLSYTDAAGVPYATFPLAPDFQGCAYRDPDHSYDGARVEWNNGACDGWLRANDLYSIGYYRRQDLPFLGQVAPAFTTCDRFFASFLGPTFPNRFYLLAATSFGHIQNDVPTVGTEFSQRSIFNTLDEAGVSWRIYSDFSFAQLFAYVRNGPPGKIVPVSQFATDARAGTLPHVVFVDPLFFGTPNVESDEHPPSNIQVGQKFVAGIVQALFASPQWPHSALFLTYDEHGGYYDHVPPPPEIGRAHV